MARILAIDDDEQALQMYQKWLELTGRHTVEVAADPNQGLARALEEKFDLIITDLQMPSGAGSAKGLEIVRQLHSAKPDLPVIVITSSPSSETAIEATRLGAYHYLSRRASYQDWQALEIIIREAVAARELPEFNHLEASGAAFATDDVLVGNSRPMLDVYREIGRLSGQSLPVLIVGEAGTGKELVARALHREGQRSGQPFVAVNCAAIPRERAETALFGDQADAFSAAKAHEIGQLERANHGTIFLDDIGDLEVAAQAKLLRVLQEKAIQRAGGNQAIPLDVRLIAASQADLSSAVKHKQFRSDLHRFLSAAVIRLPALRDRQEDIPLLVEHFSRRHGGQFGSAPKVIAPEAMRFLQEQEWLGNVRELENVVRRGLLLACGGAISLAVIRKSYEQSALVERAAQKQRGLSVLEPAVPLPVPAGQPPPRPFASKVEQILAKAKDGSLDNVAAILTEELERELYCQAIQLADGDQSKAAQWLGVSRPTMRKKLVQYGLHPTRKDHD